MNFDSFPFVNAYNVLKLYIELGWASKKTTDLKTYAALLDSVQIVQNDIDEIISDIVNRDKNLKRFLLMHSVFNSNINAHDSLEKLMINILQPDKEDQEWFTKEPFIPQELLKKLAGFEPEPWRDIKDNVVITYKMWGSFKKGEQMEPVLVTDTDWAKMEKESTDLFMSIRRHKVIDVSEIVNKEVANAEVTGNEDLPF